RDVDHLAERQQGADHRCGQPRFLRVARVFPAYRSMSSLRFLAMHSPRCSRPPPTRPSQVRTRTERGQTAQSSKMPRAPFRALGSITMICIELGLVAGGGSEPPTFGL